MKRVYAFAMLGMLLTGQSIVAQKRGDISFGIGIGLITRGGFSVRYFIADGVGVELHGQLIPHSYNYGLAVNVFPLGYDHPEYVVMGISRIGIWNLYKDTVVSEGKEFLSTIVSASSLNFGVGYLFGQPLQGEGFQSSGYLAAGISHLISARESLADGSGHTISKELDDFYPWLPFIEGGITGFPRSHEHAP
jgi:hypothetical protein